MPDDITITIDGTDIKTQPGKMVLEAAIEAGVYVPYLCYHPGMKPFAACRMCVVSVEGGRGYPAACTLPVQDGMKVRSEAPDVNELRRSVMQMLIAEHPNGCLTCHRVDICGPTDICLRHVSVNDRCVTCPKNERCEFKDTVRFLGMDLESPLNYEYRQIPLEVGDPFYDRDYNLCITCGRCVRACEEIRGDAAICFTERSGKALVGTSFGTSLLESGCEFCGACIDVCPVGALVERDHKWEKARRVERTICPLCPVGCQLNLEFDARGQMIRAVPELNSPANRGQACFKGKFGLEFLNKGMSFEGLRTNGGKAGIPASAGKMGARLTQPLIRRGGELQPAGWDEALDLIANRLMEYQGNSFALLASPNATNEELYLSQKFARLVMNTNNVDQTSNLTPELTIGLERSLGYAAATNSIWELERADCILVFNSNLTEEHNVVGVPIKKAARGEAKLVVIDPREVELTRYADTWLRPTPSSELMLLGGILKSLHDQDLEKSDWIEQNCGSPETLDYVLNSLDLDDVVRLTNVPAEAIAEAARTLGTAGAASIVYALDNVPAESQRDCVLALTNLALLTGNLGRPGAGIFPLRPGANEQGSRDVGCAPDRLPGNRPWSSGEAREMVESAWQSPLPASRGLGVRAAWAAAGTGQIKAMFISGSSPNFTNGKLAGGPAALAGLEFLVVHDEFAGPLTALADVVLPRAAFADKDGTYTNLERRIQRLKPARGKSFEGHGTNDGPKPELWVLGEIARRMGAAGFDHASAAEVMDEIASVSPIYSGVSYKLLESRAVTVFRSGMDAPQPTQLLYSGKEDRGIQWPCTADDPSSQPILYRNGFPGGLANLITPEFRTPEGQTNQDYPAWLVPGRVLLQPDHPAEVTRGKNNRLDRDEWVTVNPADAAGCSVSDGETVEVLTESGRLTGVARLDDSIPPGTLSVTQLFGQLAVELQASGEPDPMSTVPGLDIVPARLVKAPSGGS